MRVFLTGATGFIGSALVPELINAGHKVLGLSRSDSGAAALMAAGAEVHRGELEDLESLKSGAAACDGVIHCGFVHDFSRFAEVCEIDRQAVEAMGSVLTGSDRPLLVTSGVLFLAQGRAATEEDAFSPRFPRAASEFAVDALAAQVVRAMAIRLPQVHDPYKQGLITYLIALAREKGVSAYVGDGQSRWAAVHRLDAARVYRLALEKGIAGAKYHAVAEEGVPLREIAESIGRGLKLPVVSKTPEEAADHFGGLAMFLGGDSPVSSALTQQRLGWVLSGQPSLIEDLDQAKF